MILLTTIETILTVPNVLFALTFLGVIFSVYLHLKKPAEDLEHKQIVSEEVLGTKATILAAKEMENKASLLAQQVTLDKEVTDKRFIELGLRFDNTLTLTQNHIHTIDVKLDKIAGDIGGMSNDITRLATIIEERIPKRNN